jgi:hypothetical protein
MIIFSEGIEPDMRRGGYGALADFDGLPATSIRRNERFRATEFVWVGIVRRRAHRTHPFVMRC